MEIFLLEKIPVFATWIMLDSSARRKRLLIGMSGRHGRSVTPVVAGAHANTHANVSHCITKPQRHHLDVRGMRSVWKHANHNHAPLSGLYGVIALPRVRKVHQVWFGGNGVGSVPVSPFPQLAVSTRKIVNLAAQRVQCPALRIAQATAIVTLPQKIASIRLFVVWYAFVRPGFQDLPVISRKLKDKLSEPKILC